MEFKLIHIAAVIAAFAIAAIVFFLLGIVYRKKVSEKEISSAEEEARRIINESIKSAESRKREALVEAKEEIWQPGLPAAAFPAHRRAHPPWRPAGPASPRT